MREHPIIFSGPTVRAILAGWKTQTRRVIKPQPPSVESVRGKAGIGYSWFQNGVPYFHVAGPVWAVRELMKTEPHIYCPYGQPGDRLWVRETWAKCPGDYQCEDPILPPLIFYRADDMTVYDSDGPWRSSIHMPRWASRLTLEITDIKVQRVQDISEKDAIAEVGQHTGIGCFDLSPTQYAFKSLWDSINGKKHPWSSNPWVWAISFRRCA